MPLNSPVAKSSSTNMDSVSMSSSTPTRSKVINATTPYESSDLYSDDSDDDSDDDDDDEGDPLVYRFRVANPDTPSESTQENIECDTPLTTESRSSPTVEIPASQSASVSKTDTVQAAQHSAASTYQQNQIGASSPVPDHETKALPIIPSPDALAPLKRRQSKTLGNEESATRNTNNHQQQPSPTRIYTISEIVEYQPHHLRASIMEPLSMALNQQQQQEATPTTSEPSVPVEPPKLIIPPAPSYPPPLPPTKDKGRSSIMTIPPSNDNESATEKTSKMTNDLGQPTRTNTSNGTDHNKSRSGNANYSPQTPSPVVTTRTSAPPSTNNTKTGTTQASTAAHHISKYHHASYSLTNNPDAIKLYREMAEKTQDDMTQLTYAKYLLEVAELYQPVMMVSSLAGGGDPDDRDNDMKKQLDTEMRKKKALEQEGIRWIRRLSKKGVGQAAFLEATWMETEQYGYKTRHANRIERLYQMAIQAGVPEASYRLALRKEATSTPPYDVFRLYQRAADLNCVAAIYKMAKIYLHGQLDQDQDFKKGMKHLLSAVQYANITCNEPPYALALILSNKYTKVTIPSELIQSYGGVAKVREYMEMSAKLGNIGAKNRLGHLYEHGSYGPMDIAQAFMYYEEAAKQGHHLQSMLGLSRLYNVGCHGPNDHDEQYRMENDTSGWLASHLRDEDQSFYWCHRAAKGGLPDALYLLGWYYEIGFGAPRNDQLSVECYQQASRKGQLDAKDRLAARN